MRISRQWAVGSGRWSIRRVLCLLPTAYCLLMLCGCGFFKRTPNQFYSLEPLGPETPLTAPATMQPGGTPIGIDGVELPPGLDRRGIVIRGENHRLEERGQHQWASSLEEMVNHTLAFNLAKRLPQGGVVLPGQAKPLGTMRSLYVTFEDLAPGQDRVFVLDARWTLMAPGMPEVKGHSRVPVNMPSLDPPEVVAAMSRALAALADQIVLQIGNR